MQHIAILLKYSNLEFIITLFIISTFNFVLWLYCSVLIKNSKVICIKACLNIINYINLPSFFMEVCNRSTQELFADKRSTASNPALFLIRGLTLFSGSNFTMLSCIHKTLWICINITYKYKRRYGRKVIQFEYAL